MLIALIESIPNRTFGLGTYINILRGSKSKNISPQLRKNKFYGADSKHSVQWWKELCDGLIRQGFLKYVSMKSGKFPIQIIKVTEKGLSWYSMADLGNILDGIGDTGIKLEPIEMVASI